MNTCVHTHRESPHKRRGSKRVETAFYLKPGKLNVEPVNHGEGVVMSAQIRQVLSLPPQYAYSGTHIL